MTAQEYLAQTKDQRRNELFELIRFPTVSAKSEHKVDMHRCAKWLKDHLTKIGFTAEIHATEGHPLVFATYASDPKAPTVLYYGHYDVQPAEPFHLWTTPPFEPQMRDGAIYARGSTDDKGQVLAHIKGLEAILKADGTLPINVKLLIEGEEEIHSKNLPAFLRKNAALLKADFAVVSDGAQFSHTLPAINYGLRGIASAEVFITGPDRDLHSGTFGGAVANPITILCQMVAQLHDKKGKVAIPGFYKSVKPLTKWMRDQYRRLPFSEAAYRKSIGVPALWGDKQFSVYERVSGRPTCEINGITGGYQGEGAKTIIPSLASCKVTMRLVPDQDPIDICNKLEKYLLKIAPKGVKVRVDKHGGAKAVLVPTDGPWLEAGMRAIKVGYGKAPVFTREGGSIPIVGDFKTILGVDTLLLGFGQHDDNTHSPNERFRYVDFEGGCLTAAALPYELAKVARKK